VIGFAIIVFSLTFLCCYWINLANSNVDEDVKKEKYDQKMYREKKREEEVESR
jgi:uncharacterized membrane protein YwzB